MPPLRMRRVLTIAAALLVAVAAGLGAHSLAGVAGIGSAYYAKMLCSGVFVKKWDPGTAVIADIMPDRPWGLEMFRADIDRERRLVTVSLYGHLRRRALFRPGLGCTPVNDTTVDALLAQTKGFEPARTAPADLPWPAGRLANTPAPAPGVDRTRLTQAVDAAFEEPDPDNLRRTRAVVVVHKGRIITERYAPGLTPATPMLGWSLTKSAVNALTGVLLKAGKIDLDRKPVLPEWRDATDPRAGITVDHLLRMTSGLAFDDPSSRLLNDSRDILFEHGDTAGQAARTPSATAPGRAGSTPAPAPSFSAGCCETPSADPLRAVSAFRGRPCSTASECRARSWRSMRREPSWGRRSCTRPRATGPGWACCS